MKKKINGALLLLMSISMLFSSCEKNDGPKPEVKNGEIAIYTMQPNPGGQTGTAWLQLLDDLSPKTVSNQNAFQVGYGVTPCFYKDDIFTFPSYGDASSTLVITKWTRKNGELIKNGELPLSSKDFVAAAYVINPTKGYLPTRIGKLYTFNPQTMTKTGEIDLMPYAAPGLSTVILGDPFEHNGLLYITIMQIGMDFMPKTVPSIDLAVIDCKTDKVLRIIKEQGSGISIGAMSYGKAIFTDEKGDIYFICSGLFGLSPDYKTGILRIKKGETEFDPTYKWVLNDQVIEGEPNKTVWLELGHYAGGGKFYGQMDMPAYRKNPTQVDWFKDKSCISVEIDLYNKTVKKLDIPLTTSYAVGVEAYKDLIVFSVFGDTNNGFYTYNPSTGETSKEAVVKVSGYPFKFHWFGE